MFRFLEEIFGLAAGISLLVFVIYGVIAFFRRQKNAIGSGEEDLSARCPVCQAALPVEGHICPSCSWDRQARGAAGPRRIAIRQLLQIQQQGGFEEATLPELISRMIELESPPTDLTRPVASPVRPSAVHQRTIGPADRGRNLGG